MSLYPSLEDMTVGKMAKVAVASQWAGYVYYFIVLTRFQAQAAQQQPQPAAITQGYQPPPSSSTPGPAPAQAGGLYPSLEDEYMGLQLTQYRQVSLNTVLFKCRYEWELLS